MATNYPLPESVLPEPNLILEQARKNAVSKDPTPAAPTQSQALDLATSFAINSSSSSSNQTDPAGAIAAIPGILDQTELVKETLKQGVAAEADIALDIAGARKNATEAKGAVVQYQDLQKMKAQDETLSDIDAEDRRKTTASLNKIQNKNAVEIAAKSQEVVDNANIDIESHGILSWIGAQFRAPFIQEELDASRQVAITTAASIDRLRESTSDTAEANLAMQRHITKDTIAKSNYALMQEAEATYKETMKANITANTESIVAARNMNVEDIRLRLSAMGVDQQRKALDIQNKNMDRLTYKDLQDQKKFQAMADTINLAREYSDLGTLTVDQVKAGLESGSIEQKDQFNAGFILGGKDTSSIPFASRVDAMAQVNPSSLASGTPMNRAVASIQKGAERAYQKANPAQAVKIPFAELPRGTRNSYIEQYKEAYAVEEAKEITGNDSFYAIPPMNVLKDSVVVASTELWNKGLNTAEVDMADNRDVAVMNTAYDLFDKGILPLDVLANEIAAIYDYGSYQKAKGATHEQFGFATPKKYIVELDSTGTGIDVNVLAGVTFRRLVDYRDPVSIMRYMGARKKNSGRSILDPFTSEAKSSVGNYKVSPSIAAERRKK